MVVFDLLSQKTFAETPDFLSEGSSTQHLQMRQQRTVTHPPFPEQDQNLHHCQIFPNICSHTKYVQIFALTPNIMHEYAVTVCDILFNSLT